MTADLGETGVTADLGEIGVTAELAETGEIGLAAVTWLAALTGVLGEIGELALFGDGADTAATVVSVGLAEGVAETLVASEVLCRSPTLSS